MNHTDIVLREIYVDVKAVAQGTDGDFFIKPLTVQKATLILEHVANLRSDIDKRKKMDNENIRMANKLAKALAGLEEISSSKFPNSGAKADILQDRANAILKDIESI